MQQNAAYAKSTWITYFLWFFLGIFGVHKFYLGKVGWGLFYLFTFGLLGWGWIIDFFTIPSQVSNYNRGLHDGGCWR